MAWHLGIYILSKETTTKIPSHFYFLEYACCLFGEFKKIKSEVTNNFWEGTKNLTFSGCVVDLEMILGVRMSKRGESERMGNNTSCCSPLFPLFGYHIDAWFFATIRLLFQIAVWSPDHTTLSSMGLFLLLSILVQVDA